MTNIWRVNVKREDKKTEIHICHICGKDILPDEEYEYVRTRRGSELYMHKKCVRRFNDGRN